MRDRLRSFIYRRLIAATLACGITAGAGVALCGMLLFQRVISFAAAEAYKEAEDRFTLFDTLVSRIEEDTRANGRQALAALSARFPTMESAVRVGRARLKEAARGLKVSEVYFIAAGFHFSPPLELAEAMEFARAHGADPGG